MFTVRNGYTLCRRNDVRNLEYTLINLEHKGHGFPILYAAKLLLGCLKAVRFRCPEGKLLIYSSSDFWPDAFPAFLMKLKKKEAKWMAGFYLFAPNPRRGPEELAYRGGFARASFTNLMYYLSQRFAYRIMRHMADLVLVANDLDKRVFVEDRFPLDRVEPIYGGVDLSAVKRVPTRSLKEYDGCFIGRLHPQKGPIELIRIWKRVCFDRPDAKLAVIGEGPLEDEVKSEIAKNNLNQNVSLLGWVEGREKFEKLKSSRVFLHTPIQDTGGMAAAEGMACGLPVVAFDLPGYKFIYPRGMVRVRNGDIEAFARAIIKLLTDKQYYDKMSEEAMPTSLEWDWDSRARHVLGKAERLFEGPSNDGTTRGDLRRDR